MKTNFQRCLRLELLESRNLLAGLAPLAFNDSYSIGTDVELSVPAVGVLTNDTDAESDALSAVLFQSTNNGTLLLESDGSFVYQSAAGFSGSDVFLYRVNDGTSSSKLAAVTIKVIGPAINGVPLAEDDFYSVDEDGTLDVGAAHGTLANDSDPDGDGLSASLVSGPTNGLLELDVDGSFVYTPNSDFSGTDSFVYAASDGESPSEATVEITVSAINDTPVAANDFYTTDEDTALAVDAILGVLGNDSDIDGDTLEAFLFTGPDNGTLTLALDGSFLYEPDTNWNGADAFTYFTSDGTISSDIVVVEITVNAVNDLPIAVNDSYEVGEDAILAGNVLDNDSDIEGPLSATLFIGPDNGTLVLNPDGSFLYTPDADFNGTDAFTYQAFDGDILSDVAVVEIVVNAVNDIPIAVGDAYTINEDTVLIDNVLTNDSDVDGDALTAILLAGPSNGTLTLNPDGSFIYTPNLNFDGSDVFAYQASDGTELSGPVLVEITVLNVNSPPVSANDEFTTDEDTALVGDVLTNDTDEDGDTLTAILFEGPTNGTLILAPDGTFLYTPDDNFNGSDVFLYQAFDGEELSEIAAVEIIVNSVNDVPIAGNDMYATDENVPLVVSAPGVLGNDTDADGDVLTVTLFSGPEQGTIVLAPDGSFTYTPNPDSWGMDWFTYTVSDGTDTDMGMVVITVNHVNEKPIARNDSFTAVSGVPLIVSPSLGVLINDNDPDGDTISTVLHSGPFHGLLTLAADGSFIYIAAEGFVGDDAFVYRVTDGLLVSSLAVATLHVI